MSVTDTGCGIAAEDLPHVFDKFYRGRPLAAGENGDESGAECVEPPKSSGVGLGLYLVKSLAEQIDAAIAVRSPLEDGARGTRLTISLPAAAASVGENTVPA